MKYKKLGNAGVYISEITLGTVPFGGRAGFEKTGAVDVKLATRMTDMAIEAGVNFFDTANLYSHGGAEGILGKALGKKRNEILLATKARAPMGDNINNSGASRYNLIKSCEDSLRRLNTDHIDLYQIHNWDGLTPVEETLRALEELVSSGKVRYTGTSNYTAWQMMKTLGTAQMHNLMSPVTQQIYYTPESREAEYELLPMALDQNLGTLIWGPLGEGLLTGAAGRGKKVSELNRQGSGWPEPYIHDMEHAYTVIDILNEVGAEKQASVAQICLAWLLTRPGITSVIVGNRDESQLLENLGATDIKLSDEQLKRIERATRPAPQYPYWHRFTAGMDRIDPSEEPFLNEYRETLQERSDLDNKTKGLS